jgi:uncharacterized protein (DUF362 family)
MTNVAITHHPDEIGLAIDSALDHVPLEPLVRGKIVAVKPNETWAWEADQSGVTQPDTLRAVLRWIKRFEPRELVVTGGASGAKTDEMFRLIGLADVVDEEGAEFFDHNLPPFQEVALTYDPANDVDGPQKSVMVNSRVLEFDTLISLAQIKLHRTATVTMSLKNIAMSYPAAEYYGYPRSKQKHKHQFFDDLHSFIAAMAKRFPIHLAINVGHPAMIATGPLGGYPVETGIVIASTDPVAADVTGARLLGFGPQAVRHLWEAGRLGVGETDLKKLNFPVLRPEEAIPLFTKAAYGKAMTFKVPP